MKIGDYRRFVLSIVHRINSMSYGGAGDFTQFHKLNISYRSYQHGY